MNGMRSGEKDISCDQNPSASQNFISEIFLPYLQILLRMMIMATDQRIRFVENVFEFNFPPTPPLFAKLTHISLFVSLSLGFYETYSSTCRQFASFPVSGDNSRFCRIYHILYFSTNYSQFVKIMHIFLKPVSKV